jgi:hypothetical protein
MSHEGLLFEQIVRINKEVIGRFLSRLKDKGHKFLAVALISNFLGMGLSYGLYKNFSDSFGIATTSFISGILHSAITYLYMLAGSGISQVLLGNLHLPFFLVQFLMFGIGATYSICLNFLFVYRERK